MQVAIPYGVLVLGRALFASYFLAMGASHLIHFRTHAAFIQGKGVPLARLATMLTIAMMLAGGLLVLFDWHRAIGAVLLFGIIFPAPFFLHHFWRETEPYAHLSEFAHFIKDLSLAGAALLLLS
ncbi:MAG: DoxX family membrane protein [Bryobacteraceae bacterium]